MAQIYVRTKPGRRAYYEGREIPQDKFTPVADGPYVRRLIGHWEDVELQADAPPPDARRRSPPPAPASTIAKETN